MTKYALRCAALVVALVIVALVATGAPAVQAQGGTIPAAAPTSGSVFLPLIEGEPEYDPMLDWFRGLAAMPLQEGFDAYIAMWQSRHDMEVFALYLEGDVCVELPLRSAVIAGSGSGAGIERLNSIFLWAPDGGQFCTTSWMFAFRLD